MKGACSGIFVNQYVPEAAILTSFLSWLCSTVSFWDLPFAFGVIFNLKKNELNNDDHSNPVELENLKS